MEEARDLFGAGGPFDEYPRYPGHRGVDTSAEAAADIAPKIGRLQRLAFEAIKARGAYGATADDLAAILGLDRYSIQPRASELRKLGLIADSKQRRRNVTAKMAIVWTLPEFVRSAKG